MSQRSARPTLLRRLLAGGGRDTSTASAWHPDSVPYPRLLPLDLRADGPGPRSGVYLLWHLGVRPRWLRAGGAANLESALAAVSRRAEIAASDANGGVFVAWFFLSLPAIPAAVGSLATRLKPALQHLAQPGEIALALAKDAFPLPPGAGPETPPVV